MKTYSYRVVVLAGKVADLNLLMSKLGGEGYRLRKVVPGYEGDTDEQCPLGLFEREEPTP